ncbi:MAG: 16S rRNA processing protein RimM [Tissierellia bacterium]|nr:16S rRNA processing protein RimM [Tissierellia bacterium]
MDYTIVGKIISNHGIKGEVKVYPLTDDLHRFSDLEIVYIGEKKIEAEIEAVRYHKDLGILKFKGFDNINQILSFKDDYIYIKDEDRIVLPENHYFISDLINCKVYDTASNLIGHLVDVLQGPSNDVYVVKDANNKKEYLIPAVKEFVIDVNIKDKMIIIDPIEGMIE